VFSPIGSATREPPPPEVFAEIYAAGKLDKLAKKGKLAEPIGDGKLFMLVQMYGDVARWEGFDISYLVDRFSALYTRISGKKSLGDENGPRVRFILAVIEKLLHTKPPTPAKVRGILRVPEKAVDQRDPEETWRNVQPSFEDATNLAK
jgi:hypothetical protein